MKESPTSVDQDDQEKLSLPLNRFKIFVLKPISVGLFSFSIFFTIILITKVGMYLLSSNAALNLNIYDILFSLIGFTIGFLIEFLLQIRRHIFR